jgi:hypothetical protein
MDSWLLLALIASPVIVYGLTRVGAIAWFTTKNNHTRKLLNELGKDD